MTRKKAMTMSGATFAALLMLLGIFATPSDASAVANVSNLTDQLTTDSGVTTDFGGGSYFFVRFGTDAAFGIVWGTETAQNYVYFVTIKARYLGIAQVYDREGNLVEANRSVKIYTMYAVKLESLLEFNDSNENGVLQYQRMYQNDNFTGRYVSQEQLYKKVDLKTAWESSAVQESRTDDTRTWTFDLTATDLPYIPLQNYTGPVGDDKLNELKLTFHLTAKMVQVDNATLSQWRITVQRGGMFGKVLMFYDAQRLGDIQVTGKVITYNVKWDQAIEGWDYDEANANPKLLMEFGAIIGNFVPLGISWMEMNMVRHMNEYGHMVANEGTSNEIQLNEQTGTLSQVRLATQNRLSFGGDYTRIGRFEWASDVTVDGNLEQVRVQLNAGMPVWAYARVGTQSAPFRGFAVLCGMSFPGGALIVHDPTVSTEALLDVSVSDGGQKLPGVVLLLAIASAVVIVVAVALMLTQRKPGQKIQQSYEKGLSSEPGAWAKYYNKK